MSVQDDCSRLAEKVIDLLGEERTRKKLSKYAVAANSGLSEQAIGYIERRMRKPSFETILRLAQGIGVELETVIRKARR
jgi:transcriptional regulator with XRE-family HTH domain